MTEIKSHRSNQVQLPGVIWRITNNMKVAQIKLNLTEHVPLYSVSTNYVVNIENVQHKTLKKNLCTSIFIIQE